MRIAFIVWEFPVLSETFVLNQITGLIDRGHQVDIYAHIQGNTTQVHPDVNQYQLLERTYYIPTIPRNLIGRLFKGIQLFHASRQKNPELVWRSLNFFKHGSRAASLWLLYAITPLLDKEPYDIIHAQFGTDGLTGLSLREAGAIQGKLITTFRGYDISTYVKEKGAGVYRQLFQKGDFFLANCEFFRQAAIQIGCDPARIKVHGSGIDCSRFRFTVRQPSPDGVIRIVTVGRLVEKKGIEYSIRAIAELLKTHPTLEYNIVGDGKLRQPLQRLIDTLGVGDRIKLLGQKSQQALIEILDRSHIFVAPCVTARDGNQDAPVNVLKEAMAMGLPVVSTHHGGIPELVEDGISGFLVPERDVAALGDRIGYLIEHPERWSEMGQAGRTYIETHYDINQLNDRLVELYQQVLEVPQDFEGDRSQAAGVSPSSWLLASSFFFPPSSP
ncbi:glycosyltransferase [Leptothermofonsia sp. ETS-13]|uniref:glycosyltransferase n=1 Tax=Leptothermofonsia sp. ETS-13 TaxID=3035696 RepID=UPI003BA13CDC